MRPLLVLLTVTLFHPTALPQPDWSQGAPVPPGGRPNPYGLSEPDFTAAIRAGRLHALHYPVGVTALILPLKPIDRFLRADSADPLRHFIQSIAAGVSGFHSLSDVERWLGLQTYPANEGTGPYFVPFTDGKPSHRMGLTVIDTPLGRGFTVSCAECHTGNLFGRRVIGMSNRFPRANRMFVEALKIVPSVSPEFFQWSTEATDGETELYRRSRFATGFIGAKRPAQLGLDTSLAQVALSLARRGEDRWASRREDLPEREEPLRYRVADSKPAVWWTLKYKNRWLSDGSVVSGNPIYTNLIWNEVGRGTDLRELKNWLDRNQTVVRELATAVFASEPPPFTDFFPAAFIPEGRAREGEKVFNQHCARCHGVYEKAWATDQRGRLSPEERLRTVFVRYPAITPVVDVGTDPSRYRGMKSLVQLNDLAISKGIRIIPQQGYVPPPLVGIWARWPYFHNNSAPTLCAVLTKASSRPKTYWAREAEDPQTDFDRACNGYPRRKPANASDEFFYDTQRAGLSNAGHDEGVFLKNGRELLSIQNKKDLILFLQTL